MLSTLTYYIYKLVGIISIVRTEFLKNTPLDDISQDELLKLTDELVVFFSKEFKIFEQRQRLLGEELWSYKKGKLEYASQKEFDKFLNKKEITKLKPQFDWLINEMENAEKIVSAGDEHRRFMKPYVNDYMEKNELLNLSISIHKKIKPLVSLIVKDDKFNTDLLNKENRDKVELANLETIKSRLQNKHISSLKIKLLLLLGLFVIPYAIIVYLIFKIGWDKMEPITYIIGISIPFVSYIYLIIRNKELSLIRIYERFSKEYLIKIYKKNGFDIDYYNALIEKTNDE